jgi:pilus assembly protein FimV
MLKLVTGAWLLAAATQSMAVTLGSVQGSAIIGQPLDLLVRSSISAADTVSALCLKAEVVYGDTPVALTDVSVTIQRLGMQESGALRVRVRPPVNEPVVVMNLLVGCNNPFRRQYTLLAEFAAAPLPADAAPLTVLPAAVPAPVPQGPSSPAPAPGVAAAPVASPAQPSNTAPPSGSAAPATAPARPSSPAALLPPGPVAASASAPAIEPADLPETPIRLSAPAPRPDNVVRLGSKFRPPVTVQEVPAQQASGGVTAAPLPRIEREATPGGSRLQIDPIDLAARPAGAVLGKAAEPAAPSQPLVNPPAVAPAAGAEALPGTSTATTEGAAAPASAPAPLEQELSAMRQEQEKMRLALESLNSQLQQAQADRYTNPLVMGLAGLALLLLLALVWQLGRSGRSRP